MRRFPFLLLAFYLVFLAGTYTTQLFALRVVHHLVLTVLLLGWLIVRIIRRRGLPYHPLTPLVVAAIIVWLVTAFLALDPRVALEAAWVPITHAVIFLILITLFAEGKQRLVWETVFMIGALVVIAAGAQAATWLSGWLPLLSADLPFPPVLPRLDQPFGVSTWLSAYAAPMIILAVAWALTVRRRDYRPPLWGLAAFLLIVLAFTASRGGYLALGAAAAVLIMLRLWSRQSLNRWIPALFGLGVAFAGIAAIVFVISRDASRVAGDALRTDLWESAVEMVAADPLTGVGVGMFGRGHRDYRDPTYVDDRLGTAHNLFLNTAAEAGILGIAVLVAILVIGARSWMHMWRTAESDGRRLRLEAAAAALIGFGVQSLFDTFTLTSTVILPLVIAAYTVTSPHPPGKTAPVGNRFAAAFAALVIAAYGVGLLIADLAHSRFNTSVSLASLADAEAAIALDPSLRLYHLHAHYLTARDPAAPLADAVAALEQAVALEPTWDTGWLNLAALQYRAGENVPALQSIRRAASINNWNGGWFAWARLAEEVSAAPPGEITNAYVNSMTSLPLSAEYWNATQIRRAAVERWLTGQPLDLRYRVLASLDPQSAAALVPADPQTAADWWIVGHHALTAESDPAAAAAAFTQAITRSRAAGDYYLWRAYARQTLDPAAAARDLRIAERLTTLYDSVPLARIALAPNAEERRAAQIAYVSSRVVPQNFEAVLFNGRRAQFESTNPLLFLPPNAEQRAVWFSLAETFLAESNPATAAQVYRLFLAQYPGDAEARSRLDELEEGS